MLGFNADGRSFDSCSAFAGAVRYSDIVKDVGKCELADVYLALGVAGICSALSYSRTDDTRSFPGSQLNITLLLLLE